MCVCVCEGGVCVSFFIPPLFIVPQTKLFQALSAGAGGCMPGRLEPMRSFVLAAAGALAAATAGLQPPAPPRLAVNLTLTPPGYGLAPLPNASAALVFRGVPPGDGRVRSASTARWSSQSTCCTSNTVVSRTRCFSYKCSFEVPPCHHLFITSKASLSIFRLC